MNKKSHGAPCHLQGVPETRVRLEEFITKRTVKIFSITAKTEKKAKKSPLKETPEHGRQTQHSWK